MIRTLYACLLALTLLCPAASRADTEVTYLNWQLAIGDYDAALGGRYGLVVEMLPGGNGEMVDVVLADLGDRTAPVANWITAMPGRGYTFVPIDFLQVIDNLYWTSLGAGEVYINGSSSCWPDCLPAGLTFQGASLHITLLSADLPEPGSVALAMAGLLALAGSRRRAAISH